MKKCTDKPRASGLSSEVALIIMIKLNFKCIICSDERQLGVDKVHRQAKDASARLHNWALLLKNVNTYYMVSEAV